MLVVLSAFITMYFLMLLIEKFMLNFQCIHSCICLTSGNIPDRRADLHG